MPEKEALMSRIERLKLELEEARSAMPFHSATPEQFQRLEDAEENLASALKELERIEENLAESD